MVSTYNSVELAAFVALRLALGILGLASTELSEVFSCAGGDVCEEFHFDSAEGFAC